MEINEISKAKKFEHIFNAVVLLLYFAVVLFTMFHHEIWMDEAQAWLVAKSPGFLNLLKEIRVEGHPILWYLILMPFAKLNLPVIFMQIVSVFFMTAAMALLLWKSPFNKFTKVLIMFSPGLLYWLPVVARNYCLIPLFIFLFAMFYGKRKDNPYLYSIILILLSNTHILMFGFCFASFLLFVYEKTREFLTNKDKKILFPLLLLIVNFWSMILFFSNANKENIDIVRYTTIVDNISRLVGSMDIFSYYKMFPNLAAIYHIATLTTVLLIIFAIALFFKVDKKVLTIFSIGTLFQLYVYVFIWYISGQKAVLFWLMLIAALWIVSLGKNKKSKLLKITNFLLILFFLFSLPMSYNTISWEYKNNCSMSKIFSKEVEKNIPKGSTVLALGYIATIQAYSPDIKYYSPILKRNVYYHEYYNKNLINKFEITDKEIKENKIGYLISSSKINDKRFVEIYHTDASSKRFEDIFYYLYKYQGNNLDVK